jgi:predicted RNA methylase
LTVPSPGIGPDPRNAALVELLDALEGADYDFVSPTPATHRFVRNRRPATDEDLLRDVFGWNRPFELSQLGAGWAGLMERAGLLARRELGWVSTLRVSRLDGRLHWHSAASTASDAVFLGPDSYRFVRFLAGLDDRPVRRALDIGVGAGAGALSLSARHREAQVLGADINPEALRLTQINARHAGLVLETRLGDGLAEDAEPYDLIVANPPYIAGASGAAYRDGGDLHGAALALEWSAAAVSKLAPGGRFVLYTGSPVLGGVDIVKTRLLELAAREELEFAYCELDPDIFGRSLRNAAYKDVERIAAIGAILHRPKI